MYEELIERLRCPKVYECPYEANETSCASCQKTIKDEASDAIKTLQSELERERQKNILLQANADWFKAERDQALDDLNGNCNCCQKEKDCITRKGSHRNCWVWRGLEVQKTKSELD